MYLYETKKREHKLTNNANTLHFCTYFVTTILYDKLWLIVCHYYMDSPFFSPLTIYQIRQLWQRVWKSVL